MFGRKAFLPKGLASLFLHGDFVAFCIRKSSDGRPVIALAWPSNEEEHSVVSSTPLPATSGPSSSQKKLVLRLCGGLARPRDRASLLVLVFDFIKRCPMSWTSPSLPARAPNLALLEFACRHHLLPLPAATSSSSNKKPYKKKLFSAPAPADACP